MVYLFSGWQMLQTILAEIMQVYYVLILKYDELYVLVGGHSGVGHSLTQQIPITSISPSLLTLKLDDVNGVITR